MKFIIFTTILLLLILTLLFFSFSGQLQFQDLNTFFGTATSSRKVGKDGGDKTTSTATSTAPKFIPPGFRGPAEEPYVNGPEGPPPSY